METNTPLYRLMVWVAIIVGVSIVGTIVYQSIFEGDAPGTLSYREGHLRLQDGKFTKALEHFEENLAENPENPAGMLGKALALIGLNRNQDAMEALDASIAIKPDFGAAYANRGILQDRMARHDRALADYKKALELDPELADGPGMITRFFRMQWEKPSNIADRARYLEAELQKPKEEQVLRMPEQDDKQRAYKVDGEL